MSCPNIVPGNYYTLTFNEEKFDNIECIEESDVNVTSLYVLKTPKFDLKVDHNGEVIGVPVTILTLVNPLPPENPNNRQDMTHTIKIETAPTIIQIKEKYIPILEENNSGYTIKQEYLPKEIANISIVLEKITPTFALDNSLGAFATSSAVDPTIPTFSLNDGEKYFVEWDNQVYPVTSLAGIFMGMNGIAIGNTAALGIEGGSADAPFIIGCTETGICVFIALDTNTSHSIKIWQKSEQIFDSFILNSSTPGSIKKFRITIDDDGNLSASEI